MFKYGARRFAGNGPSCQVGKIKLRRTPFWVTGEEGWAVIFLRQNARRDYISSRKFNRKGE
jgi:hypothetical protein